MKFLLVLFICTASVACRRKKPEVPVPAPVPVEAAEPAAAVPPPTVPRSSSVPAVTPSGPHVGEPLNAREVKAAYHQYFARVGSFPNGWQDMVQRKFLPAVPQGKNGQPLDFVQFTLWDAGRPAR